MLSVFITRWKCAIGLHLWSEWITINEFRLGRDYIETVPGFVIHHLSRLIKQERRQCEHCNAVAYRGPWL